MSGTTKKTALASAFHTWAHGRHCNVKAERMCRSPSSYFFHLMRSFPGNSIPVGCWTRRQLDVCPPSSRYILCNLYNERWADFQLQSKSPKVSSLPAFAFEPESFRATTTTTKTDVTKFPCRRGPPLSNLDQHSHSRKESGPAQLSQQRMDRAVRRSTCNTRGRQSDWTTQEIMEQEI